jgi:hypothetical protein
MTILISLIAMTVTVDIRFGELLSIDRGGMLICVKFKDTHTTVRKIYCICQFY